MRTSIPALLALCSALLGSGCVAFNVGSPETVVFEIPAGTETRTTSRKALFSRASVEREGAPSDAGARLSVRLDGIVELGRQPCRIVDEVSVVRQKRLSFGFYPGFAECWFRPDNSAKPMYFDDDPNWEYYEEPSWTSWAVVGGMFGLYSAILVPYNLLVEPIAGNWECEDHRWFQDGTLWLKKEDGTGYRKDPAPAGKGAIFSHTVPFGFFRHVTLRFSPPRFKAANPIGAAAYVREPLDVRGPYRVDLSIPAIGYSEGRAVASGADRAEFRIPAGATTESAVALVRYRSPEDGLAAIRDESRRVLLEDAMRWTHVVPLGPLGAAAPVVVAVDAVRSAPIRYLREKDDAKGRSVYRAEILDETKDAFEIAAFVRPLLLAELSAEYAERHPGLDAASVRAWADYETEDDGSTLVFSGAAFSVQPVADGWRYDAASHRGTIRLRLSEEASLADARRWAKENVESIVRDRGVILSAGSGPPPGATYRSLSESFENGVLAIEFEAVE